MDDSGSYNKVRDDTRQQNQLPAWSNNNQMFNNGMQGSSSYNFGGNNLGGNTFDNNDCGPMSDNSLEYNEACRIVFDRFLQEGYNRQAAKKKSLEFVSNMQWGPGQGLNSLNSNYVSDQDTNGNFGNFNNGNQNWNGGNSYDDGGQQMFTNNSNWGGNFNGLNDQQMSSNWGGPTGYNGGGGRNFPMRGGNMSARPARGGYNRGDMPSTSTGRNIGGNRRDIGASNAKTVITNLD